MDTELHDSLQHELAQARAQIAQLSEELNETNQGVVALYAELDDRAEELRQVSELKSRFLSYMSHEFRVPLVAIRSMARLLLDRMDGPLLPEQDTQVRFIQASAGDLSHMVDDLLDLAKVEAGRISVSPDWFELIDLFSTLRGMFRPIIVSTHVVLSFAEPDGVPRMFSDNQKVAQILQNFISNALKFTPSGSIEVSAQLEGTNEVRFSVRDSGIGIAEHDIPKLFQEFGQLRPAPGMEIRGTGLGLALCRRFATLLGGRVSVESEVGVGSTFHLILPAASPDGGPPGVSETPA